MISFVELELIGPLSSGSGKELASQCRRYKRSRFDPWVGEIPLKKEMATCSSILAWRSPQTEEPCGLHCTEGRKESDMTEVA